MGTVARRVPDPYTLFSLRAFVRVPSSTRRLSSNFNSVLGLPSPKSGWHRSCTHLPLEAFCPRTNSICGRKRGEKYAKQSEITGPSDPPDAGHVPAWAADHIGHLRHHLPGHRKPHLGGGLLLDDLRWSGRRR